MKLLSLPSVVSLALVVLGAPLSALAQGALTPAGAPAPSMKTLAQIESRTDVATLPGDATAVCVISQPGSYFLTGDVVGVAGKHGIRIDASDVTLDLNGFSIRGSGAGSLNGIFSVGSNDDGNSIIGHVVVRNGFVRNWGYTGVWIGGVTGVEVSGVRVHECGSGGIFVNGGATRVLGCTVQNIVGTGINLVGDDSHSTVVRDCQVLAVSNPGGLGAGIVVSAGLVEHCVVAEVYGQNATGISVINGDGLVSHCEMRQITGQSASATVVGALAANVQDCSVFNLFASGASSVTRGIYSTYPLRVTGSRVHSLYGNQCTGIDGNAAASAGESFVQACQVSGVAAGSSANGISARTVLDCQVTGVDGPNAASPANGIVVLEGGFASRCNVRNTEGNGIYAWFSSTVVECSIDKAGTDGSGAGIFAINNARIDRNRVSTSATGIQQSGTVLVIGNYAGGNTTNYSGVNAAQIVSSYAAVAAGSSSLNVSF